jgi:hypothetical protein
MKTDVEVKDKNTGKGCIILEKRSFIFVAYKEATSRILSSNSKLLAVGDWIFAQVKIFKNLYIDPT